MKLDIKQLKKVSSDDSSVTFKSARGHEIKVSLSSLSPKMRGEIASLPVYMADGGEVKKEETKKEESTAKNVGKYLGDFGADVIKDATGAFKSVGSALATPAIAAAQGAQNFTHGLVEGATGVDPAAVQAEINAPTPIAPASPTLAAELTPQAPAATTSAPSIANDELSIYKGGLDQVQSGLKLQLEAEQKEAKLQQEALAKKAAAEQEIMSTYKASETALQGEYNSVLADVKAGHIDPGRVWAEKSTPKKLATVIGVLASGLGQGLSAMGGQNTENMALKILNAEIERDIEAQRSNLQQKGNVLAALSQQMGSLRAGTEMLRAMNTGLAATEMERAAAATKDPAAAARLKMAGGKLTMDASAQIAKLSVQQAISEISKKLQKDPANAELANAFFDAHRKLDPKAAQDFQDKWIPGVGFANTPKDRDALVELKTSVDTVNSGVKELLKLNEKPLSSINLKDRGDAQVIATSLVGLLRVPMTGPGAMSEGERKMIEGVVADPTKIFSLSASNKARLEQLAKLMNAKLTTTAKSMGIAMPGAENSLSPGDKQLAEQAKARLKANPNDAAAKNWLSKRGLE